MGYTHYWDRPRSIDAKAFHHWSEDVERILAHLATASDVTIRGGDGVGDPEITPNRVYFNGDCDQDLDHETFGIDRVYTPYSEHQKPENGLWFGFCKTARKPYDVAVCAALIRLKIRVPDVMLSSDGGHGDWMDAINLCDEVFQEGHLLPEGIASESTRD